MSIISYFTSMERKKLLLWAGIGAVSLIVLIVIIIVATRSGQETTRGRDALLTTPLVDGHNDVPFNIRTLLKNKIKDFDFNKNLINDSVWGQTNCKSCFTDIPRLQEGRLGAQFWVAYVPCETTQYKDAVAETLEQIDVIKRLVKKNEKHMQLVTTADGIMDAFENKKIGSMIAVEGGHSIDSRIGVLRTFYELGVRYMTLTHACTLPWADTSNDTPKPIHNLTDFGKNVVREMNRLGMMVDLSHVSAQVMRDALNVTRAPVIFSHSNAFAIHNNYRNVPDDVLKTLKQNDGIIMVNFYTGFLGNENVTIATVVNHINYIANLIGVDHVGIGADFDGVSQTAQGLEDVSKYPALFDLLHTNNSTLWSLSNLEKLAGKNLIRVFKKVEQERDKIAAEDTFEEWISIKDLPSNVTTCRSPLDVAESIDTTPPTTPIITTTINQT